MRYCEKCPKKGHCKHDLHTGHMFFCVEGNLIACRKHALYRSLRAAISRIDGNGTNFDEVERSIFDTKNKISIKNGAKEQNVINEIVRIESGISGFTKSKPLKFKEIISILLECDKKNIHISGTNGVGKTFLAFQIIYYLIGAGCYKKLISCLREPRFDVQENCIYFIDEIGNPVEKTGWMAIRDFYSSLPKNSVAISTAPFNFFDTGKFGEEAVNIGSIASRINSGICLHISGYDLRRIK